MNYSNNRNNHKKNTERQRVLVTGGASGIGAAIVQRFITVGARVAVVDKDAQAIDNRGGILASVEMALLGDVSDPLSINAVFTELDDCWGGIDVVVNNAGISIPASLMETSFEAWNQVLSVNLTGVFLVSQCAAVRMKKQGSGVIINIGSVSGMVGMPNYLSYNVSKAGVIELTKTLALELAPTIRVNTICPGYVMTPMQEKEYTREEFRVLASKVPAKRLGSPDEIAALVVYLVSEEAGFITGASFVIDGGETAGGLASG